MKLGKNYKRGIERDLVKELKKGKCKGVVRDEFCMSGEKSITTLEGSQASSGRPSGRNGTELKM